MQEITRSAYLEKLKKHENQHIIKVVSGIRRCGKSTLIKLFINHLMSKGIKEKEVIFLNFEDVNLEFLLGYKELHNYISKKIVKGKRYYIFLDEVQKVPDFQKSVSSLFLNENLDIYITGSNAYMLSSELSTLLTGRYVEIQMLPLSFKEYWSTKGGDKNQCFQDYLQFTSFPYAAHITDIDVIDDYLRGIYNSILLKDVVQRKKIADVTLLESLVKFLFDNIGSIVSSKSISNTLSSNSRKTTSITIESYIEALCESFILYKCSRYDIKGKQYLKSLEKYYLADIGFRHILLGKRNLDIGHILENIVFLELFRRGYRVNIGKLDSLEIDFVVQSPKELGYYQVCKTLNAQETMQRELAPLKKLRDNYKKTILTMDNLDRTIDGIEVKNIIDFLME